ncbi:peptidylprolyl isomerase [Rhodobaculum claviforme]|uniref:peptidylprolyl isomerase n=1 Tax=Rhodobaculum claviforme TaxID=1549854 RepID=UPI00191160C6
MAAQNPFAPRVIVDDRVITAHDIDQRALFLELFNTAGDLRTIAVERLIDERLQISEARRMGIRPSEAEIAEGVVEFASRFDLSAEEFLSLVGQSGLEPESIRSFVEAGLAWRQVLQQRFLGRVEVTDAEVARARQTTAFRGQPRVLLSELVLPATDDNVELAEMIARDSTPAEFAESARLFSASDSRAQDGRLEWLAVDALPPNLRPAIEALSPGQISAPIAVEGAVILFLMRDIDRSPRLPERSIEVEYVRATVPSANAEAELARLRAGADACADFQSLTANLPEGAVVRETRPQPDLPARIALTLARMDARQIAATPTTGPSVDIVMLCGRTPTAELMPEGAAMRNRLTDRRLEALSDGLLAELRAMAIIEQR